MTTAELFQNYESLNLRKLSAEIIKNNYLYELVERTNEVLIYCQKDRETSQIYAYEVFKNKIVLPRFVEKYQHEYIETFPVNEDFGKRAWTYKTLELAEEKYQQLNNKEVQ